MPRLNVHKTADLVVLRNRTVTELQVLEQARFDRFITAVEQGNLAETERLFSGLGRTSRELYRRYKSAAPA